MNDDAAYLILCYGCMALIPEDQITGNQITGIFDAKYGPQGDSERKLLACPRWKHRRRGIPCSKFVCDECGREVSVAHSSGWFVDEHKKERVG